MNIPSQVSIIVPTYREALNIQPLVERIAQLHFSSNELELIIVDDNSQDQLESVILNLSKEYPWLKLIERREKRSLSKSVLEGCFAAKHHTLIVMDADLSHPPEKIPEMITMLNKPSVDFVIGSRYIKNGSMDEKWPVPRRITSKIAAIMARLLIAANIKDPLSGFLCFRKSTLLAADPLHPIGWKIGLELMIKCQIKQIKEVPIHFSQRFLGKSKLNSKVVFEYTQHLVTLINYKIKKKIKQLLI